ncbi:PREDICTED: disease resistance protein RML1A-like [Camelina sativa]|uniref:Disease resistance protein RML1A-like n=1 Tax=Camelina sativa TaxID=90675 RepID=A0ABM0TS83_CAMSA|nr:PREDICTED: disease resistance protein RML1A-like [Camelina sativa]
MASTSSSSPSRNWRYGVFVSFHGPDVRKTFLSHLRKQFSHNGITMFDDHEIKRGETIAPEILKAIWESRISIVVFSKNYASSSWCLEDLVEIMKCREQLGQIVMTVLYGTDPSDVRKQTGVFGRGFNEACSSKTKEERLRWSQALNDAANIVGEDFGNWDSEADLIEKVSRDVSNSLNAATVSRDFEDKIGMEAHFQNMKSLLHLDTEEGAMIVGICGPVGIGKTTIARALHSQLSRHFHLTCFMENLKGSYNSGLDEYGLMIQLQEQLLSKILNQNGMKISHLGAIEERLSNLKVLIILDDVDDLKQLEALAKETTWFGPGSRIIVTTEDEELLLQHSIDSNSTYHVDFPTSEEALEIFCRYAFRQNYPDNGFKELSERVVDLCDNLPLSLSMVGSSLRGKKEEVWEKVMRKLETTTDHRDIEQVLRAVYEQSSSSNKRKRKSKSRHFTVMAFFVVINLLLEIASAVTDQLSSIRKPYFTRMSLVMSVLSVFLSTLDLSYKIKVQKASFRCKWPIPWFYLPARGYRRIFGSFTDTVLLFCVLGGLIVSTINYCFVVKGENGPIKVSSIWPLFFAIGMVASKFMEKPLISKDYSL